MYSELHSLVCMCVFSKRSVTSYLFVKLVRSAYSVCCMLRNKQPRYGNLKDRDLHVSKAPPREICPDMETRVQDNDRMTNNSDGYIVYTIAICLSVYISPSPLILFPFYVTDSTKRVLLPVHQVFSFIAFLTILIQLLVLIILF